MGVVIPQTVPASEDRASGAQVIDGSLRFNSGSSHYLSRTPSSAGNQTKWTFSFWVKRSSLSDSYRRILSVGSSGSASNLCALQFRSATDGNTLQLARWDSGGNLTDSYTAAVFRDVSAWYHFVVVWDTGNSTAADRFIVYTNGVRQTLSGTTPSENQTTSINSTATHYIGKYAYADDGFFDGFLSNVYLIDGQALDASYFGFTNPLTNTWRPKKLSSSVEFGTNGFYLPFDTDGAGTIGIGTDRSGRGNNWSLNGFVTTAAGIQANPNIMPDSPSGISFSTAPTSGIGTTTGMTKPSNYATLNPLFPNPNGGTYSNGNLRIATAAGIGHYRANVGMSTGKWYWETVPVSGATPGVHGIGNDTVLPSQNPGQSTGSFGYYSATGYKQTSGTDAAYGSTYTYGDVIGCAYDATNGKIYWSKNGVWQNSSDPVVGTNAAFTSVTSTPYYPLFCAGSSSNTVTVDTNFGQKPFKFPPPAGFQPLALANTPRPTIARPDQFVGIVTYTGTGATRSLNVGFKPDFVWIKERGASGGPVLYDSVRGATKHLASHSVDPEGTDTDALTSFDNNGFSLGSGYTIKSANGSTRTYVAWAWKAGGQIGVGRSVMINDVGYATTTAAGLTAGTIAPTGASINTKSGFSIITYTGKTGSQTVPHGLGKIPSFIIIKNRTDADDWAVYHTSLTNNNYMNLNSDTSQSSSVNMWNDTDPTTTVFSLGSAGGSDAVNRVNNNGKNYVAYCWAEIPGFSKFGTYVCNNSSDGPTIITGFRPKIVILKCFDSTSNWAVYDSERNKSNPMSNTLAWNSSNAENTPDYGDIDFLSNGFKIRAGSGGYINNTPDDFIWMAFAEAPAQNLFGGQSNAR